MTPPHTGKSSGETPGTEPSVLLPRRLGLNNGGYAGEKIDIAGVLRDCERLAEKDWALEKLPFALGNELMVLTRPARKSKRSPEIPARSVYISAGIHGDEPAGPLAVRRLLEEDFLPPALEVAIFPCLNPTGFVLNQRESGAGRDLNREYLEPKAPEIVAQIAWLEKQPNYDLCLCLHEDWEAHGFYIYELNPDDQPSPAKRMIEAASQVCPIDRSEVIEGRPAQEGLIRPNLVPRSRPLWPESFYLLTHKTRLSYTLEAPSDFSLTTRVASLVAAVQAAVC